MTGRDTIAAVATPPGVGGIGVIRISGPGAKGVLRRLFIPSHPLRDFLSHRLYYGQIATPETGDVLDEVLVAYMKAPHSYTGEDTVEISCHGGPLILRTVLEEACRAGARPAEGGEFTKRAFLNGRLDLAQAEAVLDLITAQTRQGVSAALGRLGGGLSGRIEAVRGALVDLLAGVEAAIDFEEEDGIVEVPGPGKDHHALQPLIDDLMALAATYRRGRITREGIGLVIAGRPNVGKSSLLNRLLGERRAIVTPYPGTTRDFIEEAADIEGIPVRLTDTAGIRLPESAIEREGIDLVWERLDSADAVLLLLDGSEALTPEDGELLDKMRGKPVLPVINKSDLPRRLEEGALDGLLPEGAPQPVRISAKYGDGIEGLKAAIRELALGSPAGGASGVAIADLRHKAALEKAAQCLTGARDGMREGLAAELIALEIREALDALGEVTGRTTTEEILGRIFSRFCVGK